MSISNFLAELKRFLETGVLNLPGRECQILDPVDRLAKACFLFERERYKHLGDITDNQVHLFYTSFSRALFSINPSDFERKLLGLDSRSKEHILREIEYSSRFFQNLDFSNYSKY